MVDFKLPPITPTSIDKIHSEPEGEFQLEFQFYKTAAFTANDESQLSDWLVAVGLWPGKWIQPERSHKMTCLSLYRVK